MKMLKLAWIFYLLAVGIVWLTTQVFSPKGPNYQHSEWQNPKAIMRCDSDADCNGLRKCNLAGVCSGPGKPVP